MIASPDTIVIADGQTIGDIKHDREALHAALVSLELEVSDIKAQLAGKIAVPGADDPDWRRRAQGALRVKIRALATVRAYLGAMRRERQATVAPVAPRPVRDKRAQALLDTIRDEIGDTEFDRIKAIARERFPDLYAHDVQTSEARE